MFISNFNSLYLRPVASGQINEWNVSNNDEKLWSNIDDIIYFEDINPPKTDYGVSPPVSTDYFAHPYAGTRDSRFVVAKATSNSASNFFSQNSGKIQSWLFEHPQYEGDAQLNLWMYANIPSAFTDSSVRLFSYSRLNGEWVPRQLNEISRYEAFSDTAQTGIFRWYKFPIGTYSSGAFYEFEAGLGFSNLSYTILGSDPSDKIEALYAEINFDKQCYLYMQGGNVSRNNIPLIMEGANVTPSSVLTIPLYMENGTLNDNIPLTLTSQGTSVNYIDLFLQAGEPADTNRPLYMQGGNVTRNSLSLYTYTEVPWDYGITFLYTTGGMVSRNNIPLTVFNNAYDDALPLTVLSKESISGGIPLMMGGKSPRVTGVPLYTHADLHTSHPLYVCGSIPANDSAPLFTVNKLPHSGGIPLSIVGIGYAQRHNTIFMDAGTVPSIASGVPFYTRTSAGGSYSAGEALLGTPLWMSGEVNRATYQTNLYMLGASQIPLNDSLNLTIYNFPAQLQKTTPLIVQNYYTSTNSGIPLYVGGLRTEYLDPFDPYTFEIEDGGVPIGQGRTLFMKAGEAMGMPMYLNTTQYGVFWLDYVDGYVGCNVKMVSGVPFMMPAGKQDSSVQLYTHGF